MALPSRGWLVVRLTKKKSTAFYFLTSFSVFASFTVKYFKAGSGWSLGRAFFGRWLVLDGFEEKFLGP